jgi:hypothetical protein
VIALACAASISSLAPAGLKMSRVAGRSHALRAPVDEKRRRRPAPLQNGMDGGTLLTAAFRVQNSSVGICVAHQGDSKVTAGEKFLSTRMVPGRPHGDAERTPRDSHARFVSIRSCRRSRNRI